MTCLRLHVVGAQEVEQGISPQSNPTRRDIREQETSVKMTITALLLALALLPALAQSDDPAPRVHDYTYVDIAYQSLDFDDIPESGRGFGLAGALQMDNSFHLWASSSSSTIELEDADITTTSIGVGVGTHTALAEDVSTYFRVGYVDAETEVEWEIGHDEDVSVDGYSLDAGIRMSVLPKLEISASVSLVSIEDESETVWGAGLVYSFARKVALGVGISLADDVLGTGVGMRFYFQ